MKNAVKNNLFITKSKARFPDKFDYTHTDYSSAQEEVVITCREHGDFTVKPSNHLASKLGSCPQCIANKVAMSGVSGRTNETKTNEQFIQECIESHPYSNYDYSNTRYINKRTKVSVICPEHGEFWILPKDFLRGDNCPKCKIRKGKRVRSGENSYSNILESHSNKNYIYENLEDRLYTNREKISYLCPIHGKQTQRVAAHISGEGCPICAADNNSGWSRTDFVRRSLDGTATLYIIKMFLDDEVFYKVGITGKSVKERFRDKARYPYLYEIIKEVSGPADKIYALENKILRETKDFLYTPRLKFAGHTEIRDYRFLQVESVRNLFI